MKPSLKRRARLVVDSVGGRVNVMPAVLARVGFTRSYFVMLRNLVARLAKDTVRVQVIFQPFKASIIGWKLRLEILERVAGHFRAFDLRFCHARIVPEHVPTVKG